MIVALSRARVFRKVFAGQETKALNSEKRADHHQQQAPAQDRHRNSCIFLFARDSGVGQDTEDESHQQSVSRNVEIKIDEGMHDVSRDCTQRSEVKCKTVAQKLVRDRDPLWSQPSKIPPSIVQMNAQKKKKEQAAADAVFGE